jgi:hypothetical protein
LTCQKKIGPEDMTVVVVVMVMTTTMEIKFNSLFYLHGY